MNAPIFTRSLGLALAIASAMPLTSQGEPAKVTTPPPAQAPQEPQSPFKPFDRAAYEAALKSFGATDAQIARFGQQIAELGAARAGDDLLRVLQPVFDAAVRKSEDNDPTSALDFAKLLAGSKDPVLGAHYRYHLARVFLASDDPDRAVEVLGPYFTENINRTPLDAEAAFFYAQALSEIPLPDKAIPRFRAFLKWFPDASERYRSLALQRIGELERQLDNQLHSLADDMQRVTRDLRKQKTDKPVQTEQQEFLEQLQKLIEEFEEKEKQSSGPPSGNSPSSNPANQSGLPEGEAKVGNLQKRPSVSDRWGDMKDRDRKEVETAVQNSLPAEYRKMLEEYYKKLGSGGSGK